jgi:hypothetical protein
MSPRPRWDKLLVLDLDDTLIHTCSPSQPTPRWVHHRMVSRYRLYLRPGAREFVGWALDSFAAVGIWTSANTAYATAMLRSVVDDFDRLAFLWSREQCVPLTPGEDQLVWHKDIARLVELGWPRERILIVDDKPEGLVGGEANLIPMPRFEGDPSDRVLEALHGYLEQLGPLADVRSVDKRMWSAMIVDEFDLELED